MVAAGFSLDGFSVNCCNKLFKLVIEIEGILQIA